jgi:hypothetical protein
MDRAQRTFERLRKVARLCVGTTSPGERASAMAAFQRVSAGTQWEGLDVAQFAYQPRRQLRLRGDVLRRRYENEAARRKAQAQVERLLQWVHCTPNELAMLVRMSERLKVMPPSAMDIARLDAIEESIPGRALLWRAFFGPTRIQLRMVRKGRPCQAPPINRIEK